jgi:hypothetical protein
MIKKLGRNNCISYTTLAKIQILIVHFFLMKTPDNTSQIQQKEIED